MTLNFSASSGLSSNGAKRNLHGLVTLHYDEMQDFFRQKYLPKSSWDQEQVNQAVVNTVCSEFQSATQVLRYGNQFLCASLGLVSTFSHQPVGILLAGSLSTIVEKKALKRRIAISLEKSPGFANAKATLPEDRLAFMLARRGIKQILAGKKPPKFSLT